ncbi:ankyrin repeat protein (macronuclear) [Tetrahymena thermophila SB210]|uniref:Ankyrin repeat protein n=1 Tax=Tetrahymena thermophila (strain SB210) TaxID=312017 RepID=I7MB74_TETTS|nr:ankyrin repeat protein [Tetrahymena thermophila SB210]EAS07792.2 ankyrin repeat protein [Tetrahymena thermophila SB210]|eukprot:XP_001028034.2 ankyrin repeat protein [Tetrahymena thermophila SB210]
MINNIKEIPQIKKLQFRPISAYHNSKFQPENPLSLRTGRVQDSYSTERETNRKRSSFAQTLSTDRHEQIIVNKLLNNSGANILDNSQTQNYYGTDSFVPNRKIQLRKVVSITNNSDNEEQQNYNVNKKEYKKSYLNNTESYQIKTFTPRNKKFMLLYGKEMPNERTSKSCIRRSESPNRSFQLGNTVGQQFIIKKKKKPIIEQAQSAYQQHVTKEEKIQFKEILVKLLNYEKDMTDDKTKIDQINEIIQEKIKSKTNLEAFTFQEDENLKNKIRSLIEEKHMKMSSVVENLNQFQDSYRQLQYGLITEDKFLNTIEKMSSQQQNQGLKGQQLLKNIIRKVQFAQRIQFVNKNKMTKQDSFVSSGSSPRIQNDSIFQNSPLNSINSPIASPYMSKNQRSDFYQAVGIEDQKAYMRNKISMLQTLYKKKLQSDQEDDRDLIEGMKKCWKFDKHGRIKVKGFQKQKSKKQDIYSADRMSRKYAYLRQTIRDFFNKCDKIGVNPVLALENKYFTSLPFTRPGSFVLFKSLKEGNLEIVNKMLRNNIEYLYERDHLLQNVLHIAIQKKYRSLSIWLIHNGIDFDQKDVANKTPIYYAIKQKMFDVAKYLLFKRASPWSNNSKYRYDQMTTNSALIRCIKKAKMIDLCGKLQRGITLKQNWLNQRKIFYLDQYCKIPGELDCLNNEERLFIEQERKKEEEINSMLLVN